MIFTLIYSTIGDPNNQIWSGLYFIANYLTLLLLFWQNKTSVVRKIGISLSISILIYVVLKYFFDFEYSRMYTIIPFSVCIVGIILIEKRQWQKSKKKQ
jgi:hypothetical protein